MYIYRLSAAYLGIFFLDVLFEFSPIAVYVGE